MKTLQTFSPEQGLELLDRIYNSQGLFENPDLDEVVQELRRVTTMVSWYSEYPKLQELYCSDPHIQNQLRSFLRDPLFTTPSIISRTTRSGYSKFWSRKYRQARFGKAQ